MRYAVIIPNHYPDIIAPLVQSIRVFEPEADVLIVADHHRNSYGFDCITHTMDRFQFSKAVNMGIELRPHQDIILLNDDCLLLEPLFGELCRVADKYPTVGILSPLIRGCVGNPVQRYHEYRKHWLDNENLKFVCGTQPVCFPCVFLRREMISKIGLLDETITGYGYDDDEYCQRARRLGWETAVTCHLVVQHGDGGRDLTRGKTWSKSFARREQECKPIKPTASSYQMVVKST
jgi:hypothetical protein